MLVHIFPSKPPKIHLKRLKIASKRQKSLDFDDNLLDLDREKPFEKRFFGRLDAVLQRKMHKEYIQDKFSKTFAERFLETKVFKQKTPNRRGSMS